MYRRVTTSTPSGHIEQLPSGSCRAKVYAGTDPLTGREIRLRRTCRTERAAQIELGNAYVFFNDPAGATPWNPDWAPHKARDLAAAAGVKLNIKGPRHDTASQLLAARFYLRNTAARLGHGSGGPRPCGTTQIPYLRWTGEPPPTLHS